MTQKQYPSLLQYTGLAFQMLAAMGLAVYFGMYCDRWLGLTIPVMIWLLPLLVLIIILVKVVKDTSKK